MKKRRLQKYLLCLMTLSWSFLSNAQEVRSKTVSFHVNNMPVAEVRPDTEPPVIKVLSPSILDGNTFITDAETVSLIGVVTDESDIKFILLNSDIQKVNEEGIFMSDVQLFPGDNRVKVVAMDDKNNISERYLNIEYTPPVFTLADRIRKESTYYGLIVGIDFYQDRNIPDLDNPVRDAEMLYNALIANYLFDEENVVLLKDATRSDLIEGLDKISRTITKEDNLIIFYAGHGWWDEAANTGFWLPSDADSEVKTNWFRNSALVDYLKEIDSKHTLLITDACFGGSIFKTRSGFPNRDKAYEKLYNLQSRKAMTSGTLTEVPDRSSFTKYLIERLIENEEEYLSSEQLFSSFRIAVINNSDAIPQYGEIGNVGDEGGDFIFIRRK